MIPADFTSLSRATTSRHSLALLCVVWVLVVLLAACTAVPLSTSDEKQGPVSAKVRVDYGIEHQRMDGFGATTLAGIMVAGNGVVDLLGDVVRQQALKALYSDVGLNLGSLQLWLEPKNDNDNPGVIGKGGFRWDVSEAIYDRLVRSAARYGFDDYSLGLTIDLRAELSWMKEIRNVDYSRYRQEAAEHVLAGVMHWQNITGGVPRYVTLFNEPLSGNRELRGGTVQEVVDLITSVGARLHGAGFGQIRLIVPAEETVVRSLETSRAILEDKVARAYVGALAYHAYPYNSAYSSTKQILQTTASGRPDENEIQDRKRLRELAAGYGIPVWMTEASEGPGRADYPFGAPENLRARANHIHDELMYAGASAYFAMYNLWDRQSHDAHFQGRDVDFFSESSHVVLADQASSRIHITGIGYAIGHYARWVDPGFVRINAISDNSLVKVSAFRSDDQRSLTLVIINNAESEAEIDFSFHDIAVHDLVKGEYSDRTNRWKSLPEFVPSAKDRLRLRVGPESVTSLAVPVMESS